MTIDADQHAAIERVVAGEKFAKASFSIGSSTRRHMVKSGVELVTKTELVGYHNAIVMQFLDGITFLSPNHMASAYSTQHSGSSNEYATLPGSVGAMAERNVAFGYDAN